MVIINTNVRGVQHERLFSRDLWAVCPSGSLQEAVSWPIHKRSEVVSQGPARQQAHNQEWEVAARVHLSEGNEHPAIR